MAKTTKRIILMGDTHCGHVAGLTPPDFQWRMGREDGDERSERIAQAQNAAWSWYTRRARAIGPVYAVFGNGDFIDGQGKKSGGTENVTNDLNKQCNMALQALRVWKTDRYVLTRGTAYHTGTEHDYEDSIAERLDATIHDHCWPEVNGLVFDLKHHLGSSATPHGRHTAIAKDRLWNVLWNQDDAQPKARFIVRSHVHYHIHAGGVDANGPWVALTLPALQLANTKFGSRRCSGTVNFGFVVVDVDKNGGFQWHAEILQTEHNKARVLSV